MTFAFKIIAKSTALAFKPGLKKQSNEARILKNFVNYYQITKFFKIQELWLLMIPAQRMGLLMFSYLACFVKSNSH